MGTCIFLGVRISSCVAFVGIDPENQELVFEKFYQTGEVLLHSSGKTKFKGGGPGLGLAIARGIDISCGCFHATSEGTKVAWVTLARDVGLIVATVPLLFARRTTLELRP